MLKKSKKLIVLLLASVLAMVMLIYIGVTNILNSGNDVVAIGDNSLGAGDWIYLDISSATNWADGGAKTTFYYSSTSGWVALNMEKYSNTLYRIRIPNDISSSGEFKFFRASGNDPNNVWNWLPGGTTNLKLSSATSNTLCVTSSDFSSYSWKSTWTIVNNAGEEVYFMNMSDNDIGIPKVIFSVSSTPTTTTEVAMTQVSGVAGLYQVTIPDGADYDTAQFVDSQDNILATEKVMNGDYEPGSSNTYYYSITEKTDEIISFWNTYPGGTSSIAGKKLYLDMWTFSVDDGKTITIQIGDGDKTTLTPDATDNTVYSYTIPNDSGAKQNTIITITIDSNEYHFLWSDIDKDTVAYVDTDVMGVVDTYSSSTSGTRKIFFDATLSKLSYEGDTPGNIGIPLSGSTTVKYKAWDSTGVLAELKGTMTKQASRTIGKNTWNDVYMVEIDSGYDYIFFYSDSSSSNNATRTVDFEIPTDMKHPCLYADTSDDSGFTGVRRDGYWEEVYKIRNAEAGKEDSDIVDIDIETFDRDSNILYINTTLYDYYSDYELNGFNRDACSFYYAGDANKSNSHRMYQPFRQFNQALSSYYEENQAESPLYWGNMQNYNYYDFKDIADTMDLYGYAHSSENSDLYHKFFYENNAMWGRDGGNLSGSGNATIGLTSDKMSNGSLMLNTNSGTVEAPFFNEDFINGNNSKNTKLGEIYKNVSFPFVKKDFTVNGSGKVEYWYYYSADQNEANKNLQLKQASVNGKYYLEGTDEKIYGSDASGNATGETNFFPFNSTHDKYGSQSSAASKLNYGFGQKLEFTFRLTEDGTILDTNGAKVPIEFVFDGDDDVWIYIDGELILDIGGAHGKVEGVIDFNNRTSTVSSVKSTTSGIAGEYTNNFPDDLYNDTDFYNKEHTLTMFYMERGLWESNLLIRFNFPMENKLSVQKEVDTTKVNPMFAGLFDNQSAFHFNIRNQATHFGAQAVHTGNEATPVIYNADFLNSTVEPASTSNTFAYVNEYVGQTNVAKWYAKYDDVGGAYDYKRWGIIYPSTGKGTYMDVSKQNVFLQFKIYCASNNIPTLLNMRIELQDSGGKTISGSIGGKTYGNSSVPTKTWTTLQIDLRKFDGYDAFDFNNLAMVKFDYDYPITYYLDEIVFKPAVNATALVGFTMKDYQIPDYGSSTSGILENTVNALYSYTNDIGEIEYGRVDENGEFILKNGQKITFSNQFRKGSYIYLKENINENIFDVSWKIYEGDEEIKDATVPTGSTTVKEGDSLTNKGTSIADYREEVYKTGSSEGYTINNSGYTSTGPAMFDENTETTDTIVFRSYIFPDSEAVGVDLLIKQINKVKTGALTVSKKQADGSRPLNGEYKIRIEFTNIAGLGLESQAIVHEVVLGAGESETITGIPAGTIYTITEVLTEDDLKLESIEKMTDANGTILGNDDMFVLVDGVTKAQGVIQADDVEDATTATGFVFVNSLTPTIEIALEKLWKASDGVTDLTENLPESIWVQIQRKASDEDEFSYVDIPGLTNGCMELLPGYDGWIKQITGLDKYKNNDENYPYTYRLVEMKKDANGNLVEVGKSFWYGGNEYKVSYGTNVELSSADNTKTYAFIITNTTLDTFNLSFTKVKGSGSSLEKLTGAEFILYEYKGDVELSTYKEIMESIEAITDSSTSWVVYDLEEIASVYTQNGLSRSSVYYLVETVMPTGMQSPNGLWKIKHVDEATTGDYVFENIKITAIPKTDGGSMPAIGYLETAVNEVSGWFITNLEQWDVPATGGIGLTYPYIAGICLMLLAVVWGGGLYYRDRRRKKT